MDKEVGSRIEALEQRIVSSALPDLIQHPLAAQVCV